MPAQNALQALHEFGHGRGGSGFDWMNVPGDQLGSGGSANLCGAQDGAIQEQIGARCDSVLLPIAVGYAAVAQAARFV